jgi:hypothetical protein
LGMALNTIQYGCELFVISPLSRLNAISWQ